MSTLTTIQGIDNTSYETVLEVKDLSFKYSKKQPLVLENISINFASNNLTIISGPNGSGKTTLMKHFTGLLTPQSGKIIVFGKPMTRKNKREIQKLIGIVFENPDEQIFFPKVYDDISFGPRNMELSWEEIRKRVDLALEEVQITHLQDRITFNLSYGEKKKVAFAGILAMQPRIIVLDEPTAGIDPWTKPRLIEIIRSFKRKRTVIVITHDLDLMQIADRILLLKNGKTVGDFSSFDKFYTKEFQV
ncbi:MAG: ABC transporter ATP-binding protein [Candidatus Heimdallarchaeota archaeon]|nr:MAG: ABC transporter ATP-binding protein [Candidatus Heimdallarchaeota archaeon]